VPAQGKVGLDSVLEGRKVQIFEPSDLVLGEGLVGEVGERLTAPEA